MRKRKQHLYYRESGQDWQGAGLENKHGFDYNGNVGIFVRKGEDEGWTIGIETMKMNIRA